MCIHKWAVFHGHVKLPEGKVIYITIFKTWWNFEGHLGGELGECIKMCVSFDGARTRNHRVMACRNRISGDNS
jgi:hypothetical protein